VHVSTQDDDEGAVHSNGTAFDDDQSLSSGIDPSWLHPKASGGTIAQGVQVCFSVILPFPDMALQWGLAIVGEVTAQQNSDGIAISVKVTVEAQLILGMISFWVSGSLQIACTVPVNSAPYLELTTQEMNTANEETRGTAMALIGIKEWGHKFSREFARRANNAWSSIIGACKSFFLTVRNAAWGFVRFIKNLVSTSPLAGSNSMNSFFNKRDEVGETILQLRVSAQSSRAYMSPFVESHAWVKTLLDKYDKKKEEHFSRGAKPMSRNEYVERTKLQEAWIPAQVQLLAVTFVFTHLEDLSYYYRERHLVVERMAMQEAEYANGGEDIPHAEAHLVQDQEALASLDLQDLLFFAATFIPPRCKGSALFKSRDPQERPREAFFKTDAEISLEKKLSKDEGLLGDGLRKEVEKFLSSGTHNKESDSYGIFDDFFFDRLRNFRNLLWPSADERMDTIHESPAWQEVLRAAHTSAEFGTLHEGSPFGFLWRPRPGMKERWLKTRRRTGETLCELFDGGVLDRPEVKALLHQRTFSEKRSEESSEDFCPRAACPSLTKLRQMRMLIFHGTENTWGEPNLGVPVLDNSIVRKRAGGDFIKFLAHSASGGKVRRADWLHQMVDESKTPDKPTYYVNQFTFAGQIGVRLQALNAGACTPSLTFIGCALGVQFIYPNPRDDGKTWLQSKSINCGGTYPFPGNDGGWIDWKVQKKQLMDCGARFETDNLQSVVHSPQDSCVGMECSGRLGDRRSQEFHKRYDCGDG
jgi:hypothetical protein